MNPYFLIGLVLVALAVWTIGVFSFWRIRNDPKTRGSRGEVPPALRLADQWLQEAQRKMEDLSQRSEQPLGTAQNELLELRLEAGRLPMGVKNLRLLREAFAGPFRPVRIGKDLPGMLGLYLEGEDYRLGDGPLAYLRTSLGEMPCLEAEGEGALTDAEMKSALARMDQALNLVPGSGGFLYFPEDGRYRSCLENAPWMEGLKSRRLMVLDFTGLTALLTSLRIAKDTDRVVGVFEKGVQSAQPLTGQSDKMSAALARLSAHSLKVRMVIDGGAPTPLTKSEE